MPGMGGMPGMGMGGVPPEMMSSLMSDPELLVAMQNPKVSISSIWEISN